MNRHPVINKDKLSSYSVVLSILVILIHTQNLALYAVSPENGVLAQFVYWFERILSDDIAKIGVPSFFMLSGILFYRDFSFEKYPQKMKNRFFSLIIPYLLWNFFRFALFYLLGKFPLVECTFSINPVVFTVPNFLKAVFFYQYNIGYWFMYQLILYTLLCPLIFLLLKKKPVAIVSLGALFLLFCTDILGDLSINVFHKKFIQIDGLFYYMLGGFIGMHGFRFVNAKNTWTRWLAISGVALGQVFYILYQVTYHLVFHISFCTVSAIAFWYLYDYIRRKPFPKSVASITFFIYSAHGTVLEFFQAFNRFAFPNTPATALLEYLLLPAITVALLVAVSKVMKRYAGGLWKLVNGSR